MAEIVTRRARPGDGAALVGIHSGMAAYYFDLDPRIFQRPDLDGFAEELDSELGHEDPSILHLVAEINGSVVRALFARLLQPEDGAKRQITPDPSARRLRIDYLATASAYRGWLRAITAS